MRSLSLFLSDFWTEVSAWATTESWIDFMDEAAWNALTDYYKRVSKKIDRRKAERAFRQNVEAVLDRIPKQDRELLQAHWLREKDAVHPFQGTKHPAPLFITKTNFKGGGMEERLTGMMASKGCCFVFEGKFVYTAPGEVVQSVIAHELAHAWIYAKYHSQNLPLPPLTLCSDEQERRLEAYPHASRHEEWFVDEIVTKWGFLQYLLEFWEIAIEDAPKDPNTHYSTLKRLAREKPLAMGLRPARMAPARVA